MKEKNLKDLLNQLERLVDKLEDKEEKEAEYELAIKNIEGGKHQTTIKGTGRDIMEGLMQLIRDIVQEANAPVTLIRRVVNGCLDELEESEED